MWQLRITNKQQQTTPGELRMLLVMSEFSREKLIFPKQREKFAIAQRLPRKALVIASEYRSQNRRKTAANATFWLPNQREIVHVK